MDSVEQKQCRQMIYTSRSIWELYYNKYKIESDNKNQHSMSEVKLKLQLQPIKNRNAICLSFGVLII